MQLWSEFETDRQTDRQQDGHITALPYAPPYTTEQQDKLSCSSIGCGLNIHVGTN